MIHYMPGAPVIEDAPLTIRNVDLLSAVWTEQIMLIQCLEVQ